MLILYEMPLKTSCVLCPNRRRQRQPQAGSDLIERSVSVNIVRACCKI